MSGAEVLALISGIVTIIAAAHDIYEAASNKQGLPKRFRAAAENLPLVNHTLDLAEQQIRRNTVSNDSLKAALPFLERCKESVKNVKELFDKSLAPEGASRKDRMAKAVGIKLRSSKIQDHVSQIMNDLQILAQHQVFKDSETLEDIAAAIDELSKADDDDVPSYSHSGTGDMFISGGGSQHKYGESSKVYHGQTQHFHQGSTDSEIDSACFNALDCPHPGEVRDQLLSVKDKLLWAASNWILDEDDFREWRDGTKLSVLWIKGGAGMGKTMMAIGLLRDLEERSLTKVAYFFCQAGNDKINSVASIIKGLIYCLAREIPDLRRVLRDRWDIQNKQFRQGISTWRELWNILADMIRLCQSQSQRIFLVVDGLDECREDGRRDFLRQIRRTQLEGSRVKWMFLSRPLGNDGKDLIPSDDNAMVSFELNTRQVAEGVGTYIKDQVKYLAERNEYDKELQQQIQDKLTERAQSVFLWIHLVCKHLEDLDPDKVLEAIEQEPPGLDGLYQRALRQICGYGGQLSRRCVRLLQTLLLVKRPLHEGELRSVTGLPDTALGRRGRVIGECCSFLSISGDSTLQAKHQSARDYLSRPEVQELLQQHQMFGHWDITRNCLAYMNTHLKSTSNLLDIKQQDMSPEQLTDQQRAKLAPHRYACTFWWEHFAIAAESNDTSGSVASVGLQVDTLLQTNFLGWLECLGWLQALETALRGVQRIAQLSDKYGMKQLADFSGDATRFLHRHFVMVAEWPLQLYSSAILLCPTSSVVRHKYWKSLQTSIPLLSHKAWPVENAWPAKIQVIGNDNGLNSEGIAFLPDGEQIAAGSDYAVQLWQAETGQAKQSWSLKPTGDDKEVLACSFSGDGQHVFIATTYGDVYQWKPATDKSDKIFDARGGKRSARHAALSPEALLVAFYFGPSSAEVEVWHTETGAMRQVRAGGLVRGLAMSPDGQQLAITVQVEDSDLCQFEVWNLQDPPVLRRTLPSPLASHYVPLCFSSDGRQLVAAGYQTILIFDIETGQKQTELSMGGLRRNQRSIALSPNNQHLITANAHDGRMDVWDIGAASFTEDCPPVESSHGDSPKPPFWDVSLSQDGQRIAFGMVRDYGSAVQVLQVDTGQTWMCWEGNIEDAYSAALSLSPDGRHLALGLPHSRRGAVIEVETERRLATVNLREVQVRPRAVAVSLGGKYCAAASNRVIRIWELTNRIDAAEQHTTLDLISTITHDTGSSPRSLSFSADSQHIIADTRFLDRPANPRPRRQYRIQQAFHNAPQYEELPSHKLRYDSKWVSYNDRPLFRFEELPVARAQFGRKGDHLYLALLENNVRVHLLTFDVSKLEAMG